MQTSYTKFNARYRGPTYINQICNAMNEIINDLSRLDDQATTIQNDLIYASDGQGMPSYTIDMPSIFEIRDQIEYINTLAECLRKELVEC